ncbi:MAG TPA: hypothetical protein VKM55_22290 [Candidatus Lokiarchaeia archaeon]|nr:hypothetical protein [Candidatus Lokiarchaeia archaeon]
MKPIGFADLKPLRAIRPQRQDGFALPDRKVIEGFKQASLAQEFKDIPSLNELGDAKKISAIDDILLSLAWNNPGLSDIPVLTASNEGHAKNRSGVTKQDPVVADASAVTSVEQFLKPDIALDSLVSPSADEQLRNAHSLYKIAISSSLRKSFTLKRDN